ncbi:hypothetical protein C0995_001592 [Termitomyces sp. Mi166|nr:hypothetical protein C0995_001592 [Termitomyces sp. Mi166\
MALANGVYIVRNRNQVGQVLDMSTQDGTTITGYPEHDGLNQQWYIFKESSSDDLYSLRDGYYGHHVGYGIRSGRPMGISACLAPVLWRIVRLGDGTRRITAAEEPQFVFELGDDGLVFINKLNSANAAQVWSFERPPYSKM